MNRNNIQKLPKKAKHKEVPFDLGNVLSAKCSAVLLGQLETSTLLVCVIGAIKEFCEMYGEKTAGGSDWLYSDEEAQKTAVVTVGRILDKLICDTKQMLETTEDEDNGKTDTTLR